MHLRFAVALAAVFATLAYTPARADLLIQVDKSTQQMTVSEDGQQLYTWPVSTGRRRLRHAERRFHPVPHGPRPLQPRVGRRADALFDLLHQAGPRHPRNQPPQPRPAGLARLRAAVGEARGVLWDLVKKNKMGNTTVVLTGTIPGGAGMAVAHAAPRQPQAADDQDDDEVTAVPPRRTFGRNGWLWRRGAARYYYRERPLLRAPARLLPVRLVRAPFCLDQGKARNLCSR